MTRLIILSSFLLVTLSDFCFAKLPASIKVCSRHEPNLGQCIIDSVKELQPRLATGKIDPNFVVPALEPLMLDNIKMDRGQDFKAQFTNLLVTGPSNFEIEKIKVTLENGTFDFIINLPRLDFVGKYQLKIRILLLDIQGKGDMDGTFENCRARVKMRSSKYEKNGETFLKFEKFTLKIQIGKNRLNLKNLFNGDPNLGQIGNQFINQNSELFLNEIIPGLEKNLADIFQKTANDIVATASYDDMFPDRLP